MAVAAPDVVGREDEIARVREFVSRSAAGARALVIRGEPGIGKTTLWRAAIECAEAQSVTVLSARCIEAELPLGLAGLADLLGDALPAAAERLAHHERAVLAAAVGIEAPREEPRDAIRVPRAFRSLLRALALEAPVLVAIDDAQWLDAPSARVVSFAARRLGEAPVGLLVTLRDGESDPLGLSQAFGESFEEVPLGPLSLGALAQLVRSRLGARIPRPVLARVDEASGGNPMFALEFARLLADRGGRPAGPVPLPSSLQELVRARLDGHPSEVRRLLGIVAACDRPTRSLLSIADPAAADSIPTAVDAGVIAVGADGAVRFTHPLLASAAYADLPPSQRREVHARLAEVIDDVEARARQLALAHSEPDASVAQLLDDAAERAHARGATEAAAELAYEAVRLTPAGTPGLGERMLSVADYLAAAGRSTEASEALDRLLATRPTGPLRARALFFRGWAEPDLEAGHRILVEAFEHAGDDATLRARLLLSLSSLALMSDEPELAASERAAREALVMAERAGDPQLLATALSMVADRADLAGHPDDALAERAIELEDRHGAAAAFITARWRMAAGRLRRGDLGGARGLREVELGKAVRAGSLDDRYMALMGLFDVEWRAGNWQLAEQYLEEAWSVGVDEVGDRLFEAELTERRARLTALRGEAAEARRRAAEGIELAEGAHYPQLATMNRWVLGFLELSVAEPARAWDALAETAPARATGSLDVLERAADGVDALVALDRLDEADELTATLRDEAARGHIWAVPAAWRCEALLLIARGDAEAAALAAERAADGFDAAGFPLDRGRALFVAGEALRRAGKRRLAATAFEAARDMFNGLGARLWFERAETELRRASPRPRRDGGLTNAELRVAALVASGKTNREVASQLFTTVNTVEKHLTRIYRKLGVRSRTELATLVAAGSLVFADESLT